MRHEPEQGSDLAVRYWSEVEFSGSQAIWDELRARSDADPLFMAWEWQWLWWQHHKELLGGQLAVAACYAGDMLVGLAPFYLHEVTHRGGLRATRLEILGSTFRDGRGVFSEYLDIIADRERVDAVVSAIAGHLLVDKRWDGVLVANTPVAGVASRLVRRHLASACLVREIDPLESHVVELPQDFASYLETLSGSARRKIWNQRSKLEEPAMVVAGPDEVRGVFDQIDAFHLRRWECPQYVGVARSFHFALAPLLLKRGALRLSTLYSGGSPIAVMYNVRVGETEYNLQSGFDPERSTGLSPGYLHFGYCMEVACREGVKRFDFLAGEGRFRQYKRDFNTTEVPFITLQVIRARRLRILYGVYAMVTGGSRRLRWTRRRDSAQVEMQ